MDVWDDLQREEGDDENVNHKQLQIQIAKELISKHPCKEVTQKYLQGDPECPL